MHREKEIPIPFTAEIILHDFCASLRNISLDFVKGIYLTGSIPLKDFQHGKSDIDFIVVCSELPNGTVLSKVKQVTKLVRRIAY